MKFDQKLTEHVQLNGVIDRMDESPSSVRVMDYKSSSKSLSEAKIKAGIQLQLLSYMLIAASLSGKRPAGVYYISMKPQSTSLSAGSFKTTNKNGVPMNDISQDSVLEDAEISSRRIGGWAFEDPAINEELYAKYFTPGKGEYSFDLISACIRELYETFFREATSGRISVEPLRGACLFCDYKAVCRFHGQPGPYVPRVDSELRFKKGKGDAE